MATPALRIQDQNQNILYSGAATGGKTDVTKTDKRGGQGGRKALNDISNSRKPSALHSVKKDGSINVIPLDEKDPRGVKAKISKASEKGKLGGRKALTDLTNSVKPPIKQVPGVGRKLNAVAEENVSCIMDEGFLHNHQECIKAQKKSMEMDMDYFLKTVGLSNDFTIQPSARRALPLSPKKIELKEISEDFFEDRVQCKKSELRGFSSPARGSPPQSPKAPYMSWEEDDDIFDLSLID